MGIAASELTAGVDYPCNRDLGLKSYQTAWAWLHKFRRAMVRPGRDPLSGVIQVDEAYVGGAEEGVAGRQTETIAIVAIAEVFSSIGSSNKP